MFNVPGNNFFFFFFCITDNWQNNIWHKSAYKVKVYHWIPPRKKCTCWHSLTLSGILWRPNCECEHKQWVTCFSDVCDKTCSGWPCTIVMPQNIPYYLKYTANDRWLCRKIMSLELHICSMQQWVLSVVVFIKINTRHYFRNISCTLYVSKHILMTNRSPMIIGMVFSVFDHISQIGEWQETIWFPNITPSCYCVHFFFFLSSVISLEENWWH